MASRRDSGTSSRHVLRGILESGMIQRYSRQAMRDIWSEQRKLEIWLQIELLASEALCAQGLVPKKDLPHTVRVLRNFLDSCRKRSSGGKKKQL